MRALRIINLIFSLVLSATLLFCGAAVLMLNHYIGGLIWLVVLLWFLGMWGSR